MTHWMHTTELYKLLVLIVLSLITLVIFTLAVCKQLSNEFVTPTQVFGMILVAILSYPFIVAIIILTSPIAPIHGFFKTLRKTTEERMIKQTILRMGADK